MAEAPLFYSKLTPLSSESHRHWLKRPRLGYGFAVGTNALPLTAAEFVRAVHDYPLVFAGSGDDVHTIAVVGLAEKENLMVDSEGNWEADCYVPGYVRRYPFILARQENSDDLAVCVDVAEGEFDESEGEPLFDEQGAQTPYLERVLNFAKEYQQELERTRHFARAMDKAGLLEDVNADVALKVGSKYRLAGMRIVNRRKLTELDAETCKQWVANGYLEHAYLHLASLINFQALVDRLAARHPEAPHAAA